MPQLLSSTIRHVRSGLRHKEKIMAKKKSMPPFMVDETEMPMMAKKKAGKKKKAKGKKKGY